MRPRSTYHFAGATANITSNRIVNATALISGAAWLTIRENNMAASVVPHFANDAGAEKITVGVKELKCMGARAPHDHPHVFLDMGGDDQVLCPYCSTLYRYDERFSATDSDPEGSIVNLETETH